MAAEGEGARLVYRVSTNREWDELQKNGSTFGGEIDRTTGCIHLSTLSQVPRETLFYLSPLFPKSSRLKVIQILEVKGVLKNFFQGREDLYLLEIDAEKLGEGLIYESVDDINFFPHLYGPDRSFIPLKLEAVIKAVKLQLTGGEHTCNLLG